MENLKKTLISIWQNDIKEKFEDGKLVYERQFQAEIYHLLENNLNKNGKDYDIWVEPVIYLDGTGIHKTKPDLVITKAQDIIGVIELKFKPWEYPHFKGDIDKLMAFRKAANEGTSIWLGIKFICSDGRKQFKEENLIYYNLKKEHLTSFVVFARPDSNAIVDLENYKKMSNFLLLYGHIIDTNNMEFNHKAFP